MTLRLARWERTVLDADLAPNGCAMADIDGDGVTDAACIDAANPWSLKWYGMPRR